MKIGVIGGGAAGLTAAIAARREGADVTILESKDRVGQKILATGNGKCNLGNLNLTISNYYGTDLGIAKSCLSTFGTKETIAFFQSLGLMIREKNGYLYPYSEQASAVLDVLRQEIDALGVTIVTDFPVRDIQRDRKKGFLLLSDQKKMHFDLLILALGGKAAPKTGSDGSGYHLAGKLGHRIVPVIPALTFLKSDGDIFKAIAGVRAQAEIMLKNEKDRELARESGELQITEQGLSGIPVFQLSRVAGYALENKEKIHAEVDFFPDFSNDELKMLAQKRLTLRNGRTLEGYFTGVLNKKLMQFFLKTAGFKGNLDAKNVSPKQLEQVLFQAKRWIVPIKATGDFQHAQVCAGGVDFSQVTPQLESKLVPNLFFAGEILDIDGKCGGYNLQWAWCSGYLAGCFAAERAVRK